MLASMRSIRACRFFTPWSVRGGKYSSETWAMFSGSLARRSMILGSGWRSELLMVGLHIGFHKDERGRRFEFYAVHRGTPYLK